MIIDPTPKGPAWVTIVPAEGKAKATRVQFLPVTRAMRRRAFRAALTLFPGLDLEDEADTDRLVDFSEEAGKALVREAATDWDGVIDPAKRAIPFGEEALKAAIADEASGFFDAVDRAWLAPLRARDAEKNGLSALPVGTGKAATRGKITARSAAASKGASAATPARTAATPRGPRKGKGSGTS